MVKDKIEPNFHLTMYWPKDLTCVGDSDWSARWMSPRPPPSQVTFLYGHIYENNVIFVSHTQHVSDWTPPTASQPRSLKSTPVLIGVVDYTGETARTAAMSSGKTIATNTLKVDPNLSTLESWIRVHLKASRQSLFTVQISEARFKSKTFSTPLEIQHQSVILYEPPDTRALRYLSIRPLELDIYQVAQIMPNVKQQELENQMLLSCRNMTSCGKASSEIISMDMILEQMNAAYGFLYPKTHPNRMSSQPELENVFGTLVYAVELLIFWIRLFIEWIIYFLGDNSVFEFPLTHYSSFAQQIDVRLQQLCFWPWQHSAWRHAEDKTCPLPQAQYVGFYNVCWLIANDIIIGSSFSAYIVAHNAEISQWITSFLEVYTIQALRILIIWLMGAPGGLKLNKELTMFIGELFLWLLATWEVVLQFLSPHFPFVIRMIGYTGICGLSVVISLFYDFFALSTAHLSFYYSLSSKLYFWEMRCIHSLFTLFRGQRINPLRLRVDTAEYELDQLLLGTLMFSFLVFLFPTVFVYYALFSFTRVLVFTVEAGAEISLAFLNHFPLFSLMLRLKDPGRLPHGIKVDIAYQDPGNPNLSYLQLNSVPIGFSTIFYQYIHLWNQFKLRYLTFASFYSLMTGRTVARMNRLDYPIMPDRAEYSRDWGKIWKLAQGFL